MTAPVFGVGADQTGADVMLTMLDHDIRHVPVFSSPSNVLGIIVGIDLVAAEARSPFVLRRAIARARNKEELRDAAAELRSTVVALHRAELTPFHVSDVVSAVTDALIRRMIELAIESQGPPPAEFAWMALGSHGRREPMPSSDVDSGMSWRDRPASDPITRRTTTPAGLEPDDRLHAGDRGERGRLHPGDRLAAGSPWGHGFRELLGQLDRGLAPAYRELARVGPATTRC